MKSQNRGYINFEVNGFSIKLHEKSFEDNNNAMVTIRHDTCDKTLPYGPCRCQYCVLYNNAIFSLISSKFESCQYPVFYKIYYLKYPSF